MTVDVQELQTCGPTDASFDKEGSMEVTLPCWSEGSNVRIGGLYRHTRETVVQKLLLLILFAAAGKKSELFSSLTSFRMKKMNHLNPAKDSPASQPTRKTDIVKILMI